MCMAFVLHVSLWPMNVPGACRGRNRACAPLELEVRWLGAALWLLAVKPGSSGRAARAPTSRIISPAPWFLLFYIVYNEVKTKWKVLCKRWQHIFSLNDLNKELYLILLSLKSTDVGIKQTSLTGAGKQGTLQCAWLGYAFINFKTEYLKQECTWFPPAKTSRNSHNRGIFWMDHFPFSWNDQMLL